MNIKSNHLLSVVRPLQGEDTNDPGLAHVPWFPSEVCEMRLNQRVTLALSLLLSSVVCDFGDEKGP